MILPSVNIKKTALSIVVIAYVGFGIAAQTASERITPDEIRDANKIAHRFSDRLMKTKDITPLIKEFFVKDFLQKSLENERNSWSLLVQKTTAKQLTRPELRRLFIAENNWFYLSTLYYFSKYSSTDSSNRSDEVIYPAAVRRVILKNRYLKIVSGLGISDDANADFEFRKTRKELTELLRGFETVEPMMRRLANKTKAGHTQQWRDTMTDFGGRFWYYKPQVDICDNECFGMAKGTRIYIVNVPVLQLAIMKSDGQMKIIRSGYYAD